MIHPEQVVDAARAWLGTPFHHQGRAIEVGVDCAGVVVGVARALGIEVEDVAGYGREPHRRLLEQQLERQLLRVPAPKMGDVLLMRFAADPQHVAICAGETIIHAYSSVGRCVEHRYADVWRRRTVAVYRFPGVC